MWGLLLSAPLCRCSPLITSPWKYSLLVCCRCCFFLCSFQSWLACGAPLSTWSGIPTSTSLIPHPPQQPNTVRCSRLMPDCHFEAAFCQCIENVAPSHVLFFCGLRGKKLFPWFSLRSGILTSAGRHNIVILNCRKVILYSLISLESYIFDLLAFLTSYPVLYSHFPPHASCQSRGVS